MENFWFYVKLGLNHVLDIGAYDHVLFLAALAAPFTFKSWQKILILATIFTVAHCTSLAFSAYGIVSVNVEVVEFLIPVTIMATAVYNLLSYKKDAETKNLFLLGLATTFFGLVHGFGFSNYFKMLMAEEVEKLSPLLGFAAGIEISQVLVLVVVLLLAYIFQSVLNLKRWIFTVALSILIVLVTIPLLITTFPG
jgi:hypothetical protein